jgi:hypothetical protein
MIRHTVVFKLKHPSGSQPEHDFLQAARILATIPTVRNFEALRQTSRKNNYDFGFSMEFSSSQDYQIYPIFLHNHPKFMPHLLGGLLRMPLFKQLIKPLLLWFPSLTYGETAALIRIFFCFHPC